MAKYLTTVLFIWSMYPGMTALGLTMPNKRLSAGGEEAAPEHLGLGELTGNVLPSVTDALTPLSFSLVEGTSIDCELCDITGTCSPR